MALNYDTLYAIPRLTNYAEAKKWHDDVVPIRGDEHGTRPCGRRDQKWFSIWMRNNDVHVGYGSGELEKRQSLVIYHKDGTITVEKRNRWSSASDNERRNRLLGIEFKTHQYDTWVHCAWYDGGQKRKGYLPVKCNGQRGWDAIPAQSTFVRDSAGDMVFLNYTYPVTHKVDRPAMNQALKPFRSFITFIEGLRKLQGTKHLGFSQETYAEYFGWADSLDWHGNRRANVPPTLFYGSSRDSSMAAFLEGAASDDLDDRMRAALALAYNTGTTGAAAFITDIILHSRAQELLRAHTHTDGKLVTDLYRRYLRG